MFQERWFRNCSRKPNAGHIPAPFLNWKLIRLIEMGKYISLAFYYSRGNIFFQL
jgi:hypothetical protein